MIISNKTVVTPCTRENITVRVGPQGRVIQSHSFILFDVTGRPMTFIGRFIDGSHVGHEILSW